jgi:hypothetical protein
MSYLLHQIPIFAELQESKSILLAGVGGGFDIFSGIPLYFNLKKQGKQVILANYSFTRLVETTAEKVFPYCYKVQSRDSDLSGRMYFPEKYLKSWFELQDEDVEVYAFSETGTKPLKEAYQYLVEKHDIDTVLLVDGGTDSLMFGDEDGLGTPQEDICSMAAAYQSGVQRQYLVSVGFGIDHFHGVSHFRFLENVAQIAKEGGYLGMFQITKEMEEAEKYIEAVMFVNNNMRGRESIVSNSIVSALEGEYGDYHRTRRTKGSILWVNPLMTIYWCFNLQKVVQNIKYYDKIKDVETVGEFNGQLSKYRHSLNALRDKKQIPL